MCLCELHNFCVEERLDCVDGADAIHSPAAQDSMEVAAGGGLQFDENCDMEGPDELLRAGHHFDDVAHAQRVAFARRKLGNELLPRDKLHSQVARSGFKRPTPRTWQFMTTAAAN